MEDRSANAKKVFSTLGASNHSEKERAEHDFYATSPQVVERLLAVEKFAPSIWECACGKGHISEVLKAHGYNVRSTDLIYRGYGEKEPYDFLTGDMFSRYGAFNGDIVTNPPFKYALEFVKKALETVTDGHRVAMLLRIQFLEGKERRKFFKQTPPEFVYVYVSRAYCVQNGDFESAASRSAMCLAWFIWRKGFTGEPKVRWID